MKILIVDDDHLMLEAMAYSLRAEGYEVLTADDGYKAMHTIQNEKIDLLICDILMPNITGLALLNLLKQFYYDKIPVIIISSLDKADVILCSLGMGAEDFIAKPINFDELSIRVKKFAAA
jgi:two-component system response regulator MprA